MANMENLPEDVKRLIAGELDKCHSVRSLWQVSRTWRAVAESFVYRGLVWTVDPKSSSIIDDAKRLSSDDDPVNKFLEHARYVLNHSRVVRLEPVSIAHRMINLDALPFSLTPL